MTVKQSNTGIKSYLLFENDFGEGTLISTEELLHLVRRTVTNLDLVFVAACDSELVGKIFQSCSAKHVICVKQKRFVLDQAAIAFTKIFYSNVLDEMNICEAFEKAKAAVGFQFQRHEADLFTILLQGENQNQTQNKRQQSKHICYSLQSNGSGQM